MSREIYIFVFLILTLWLPVWSGLNGQALRVVGSDFAGSVLQPESQEGTLINTYKVDYQMTGSLIGLIKLREKYADVAFVLQTRDAYPNLDGLVSIPLGFWGVYFAVIEENPLSEVGMAGLSEILRKTKDGLKSEWGVLMPDNPKWTNRLIFPTFIIRDTDASYPVLLDAFFNNEAPQKLASRADRIEDPSMAGASNLLIMSRLPSEGKGLRVLSLIQADQTVGFPPSGESMHYGDYPLRSSLHLVARDRKDPKVLAFVRDFFKNKRLELLERKGLVKVPENVLKQALLEFDLEF